MAIKAYDDLRFLQVCLDLSDGYSIDAHRAVLEEFNKLPQVAPEEFSLALGYDPKNMLKCSLRKGGYKGNILKPAQE